MISIALRFLPYIAALAALFFIELAVYNFGADHARSEVTAHYETILAERDRAAAQALAQALEDQKANARAALEAERNELHARAVTEAHFKTITQTVTKYVEKNPDRADCAVRSDFMRVWNSANRGATRGDGSDPRSIDGTMSSDP